MGFLVYAFFAIALVRDLQPLSLVDAVPTDEECLSYAEGKPACRNSSICRRSRGSGKLDDYESILPSDLYSRFKRDLFITENDFGMYCDCEEAKGYSGGFTGLHCDLMYEDCPDGTVCLHGAPCVRDSYDGSKYHCDCTRTTELDNRFAGVNCEYEVTDVCKLDSEYDMVDGHWFCTNGAECRDWMKDAADKCDCPEGTYGLHCEQIENRICNMSCYNGGVCNFGSKDYSHMSPQLNDHLSSTEGASDQHCACPEGFTGLKCEIELDRCDADLECLHGSECKNNNGEPYCACSQVAQIDTNGAIIRYAGTHCAQKSTIFCPAPYGFEATDFFCTNNGKCPERPSDPCECGGDFTGSHCEFPVEAPATRICDLPCMNGGTCFFGSFTSDPYENLPEYIDKTQRSSEMHCRCTADYKGPFCDIPNDDIMAGQMIDDVTVCGLNEHKCLNGGECVHDNDFYTCECVMYAGLMCQHEATTHCGGKYNETSFCTNNGACKDILDPSDDSHHPGCKCVDGFQGDRCDLSKEDILILNNRERKHGPASKAFLGFVITLFGIVAIYFLMIIMRRRETSRLENAHVPIEFPQKNISSAAQEQNNMHYLDEDDKSDDDVLQNVQII